MTARPKHLLYCLTLSLLLMAAPGCSQSAAPDAQGEMAELLTRSEQDPFTSSSLLEAESVIQPQPVDSGAALANVITVPNPAPQDIPSVLGPEPKEQEVGLRVIGHHFDKRNVHFTVLLRNNTSKGTRVRLRALGYDKNRRIVQAREKAIYFQPREMVLENYTLAYNAGVSQWQLTVR